MPNLIDTHCHLNFNAYKEDYKEVIKECLDEDIWMILVGAQLAATQKGVEIASSYEEGVYASVGLHPIHIFEVEVTEEGQKFVTRAEEFNYEVYKALASQKNVVAIGETGLDYFRTNLPIESSTWTMKEIKQKQKDVLIAHIQLANELEKPVIFHTRSDKEEPQKAYQDLIEILKEYPVKKGGVIHCYSGDLEMAQQFVKLGYHISFTGIVTFTQDYDDVIAGIDLSNIMVETDSPFLTPTPNRGKRNSPAYVKYVAEKIAKVKNITTDEVAKTTTMTARNFFNI